jgi:hypothetical protein
LISRKSVIQIFSVAALLICGRLAVDFTSAAAYVYPEYDFGQFWLASALFLILLLFAAVLAAVRVFQKRFIEGLVLFVILSAPFSFKDAFDRYYWKFRIHKLEYQSAIQADSNPPPKYRVFNWGNRNTHSMGGGVIFEAIVYDETDEIGQWSPDWLEHRSSQSPEDRWITTLSSPSCHRRTKSLGQHFYYVSAEC